MDWGITKDWGGLICVLIGNGGPGQDLVCDWEKVCKAQISDKKMTIGFNVTIQAHKGSGNYKTLSLQFIPWMTAPSKEKE